MYLCLSLKKNPFKLAITIEYLSDRAFILDMFFHYGKAFSLVTRSSLKVKANNQCIFVSKMAIKAALVFHKNSLLLFINVLHVQGL